MLWIGKTIETDTFTKGPRMYFSFQVLTLEPREILFKVRVSRSYFGEFCKIYDLDVDDIEIEGVGSVYELLEEAALRRAVDIVQENLKSPPKGHLDAEFIIGSEIISVTPIVSREFEL